MRKNSVPTKSISHHVPKIFRFLLAYLAHLDCLHTGTFHFSGVLPLDKRTAGFACYNFPGCWSNSYFDYNTFSHCRWYSIPTPANMFLSIPRMAPCWLYMVMFFLLQLTELSLQLSTKISTIKNFQISYTIYNTKIAQRLLHSVLLHRRHLYRASNPFPTL